MENSESPFRFRIMDNKPSVVQKTYDFLLWLLPHIAKFSRQHRFTLGDRLEREALDLLMGLVEAGYSRDKRDLLQRANLGIERLRFLVRLSKDLQQLNLRQYGFAAES